MTERRSFDIRGITGPIGPAVAFGKGTAFGISDAAPAVGDIVATGAGGGWTDNPSDEADEPPILSRSGRFSPNLCSVRPIGVVKMCQVWVKVR